MKTLKVIILGVMLLVTVSQTMAQNGVWLPLGAGTGSSVYSVLVSENGIVYVGGNFLIAGGDTVHGVAKWDGTSWSSLGTGVNGTIHCIAVNGNDVYVGGIFSQAGGIPAKNIAKWDGSTWSALGTGLNDYVYSIEIKGNDLYAGGGFSQAGGNSANKIAKWDGSTWSALGTGLRGGTGPHVQKIVIKDNDIYVGGKFLLAGSDTVRNIAKWDGTNWSGLGTGFNNYVFDLAFAGDTLYAGGQFSQAGGNSANRIAKWDGSNWSPVGSGIEGSRVTGLAVNGSDIYAGGVFTAAGGDSVRNIARWDGASWSPLGTGLNDQAIKLAFYNNSVYAVGPFTEAGGNQILRVAEYYMAPPAPVNLSFSIPSPGNVQLNWSDTVSNEDGFVVERSVGTDTNWMLLDTTAMNTPSYLDTGLTNGTYYYRVYAYNTAGNSGYSDTLMVNVTHPPLPPHSLSLNVLDTGVVKLTWADSSSSEDGFVLERKDNVDTNWTAIDTTGVDTVTYTDTGLTVGRTYEWRVYAYNAGGNSGYSNIVSTLITGILGNTSLPDKYAIYQNYPNPFNPSTKIKFDIPKSGIVKLTIYDILGRQVSTLVNNELTAGRYEMEWSAGSYSSGIYFYRIEADGFTEVKRMMLVK